MSPDPREPQPPAWIVAPTDGHPSTWHHGIHSLPYRDLQEHAANRACWCVPTQILVIEYPTATGTPLIGGDWQHHAADGRPLDWKRQQRLEAARRNGPRIWGREITPCADR